MTFLPGPTHFQLPFFLSSDFVPTGKVSDALSGQSTGQTTPTSGVRFQEEVSGRSKGIKAIISSMALFCCGLQIQGSGVFIFKPFLKPLEMVLNGFF